MKITCDLKKNKNVEIIDVIGDLKEGDALDLRDYLYTRLDARKYNQLIDLKNAKKIDALGIKVLNDLVCRGIRIGLFNVDAEIRMMLRMARKEDIVAIYNELDVNTVVSKFENYILIKKSKIAKSVANRCYKRVRANFSLVFEFYRKYNDIILANAKVVNISEGGMLIDNVTAKDYSNIFDSQILSEIDSLYFKFMLMEKPDNLIKTKGKCVWEFLSDANLIAGICFKEMNRHDKRIVRDFVNEEYLVKKNYHQIL